ncbi:hypothetical protein JL721_8957 [Aureococcus anophagefferens]|nr:hypothetical protein JL721_8957 [Aureococcus anophagefferens]
MAAFGLSNVLCNVTGHSLLWGIGSGFDTLAPQAWGADERRKLGVTAQRVLAILVVAVCAPVVAVWLNASPILLAAGQDRRVALKVESFARIRVPGLFAQAPVCVITSTLTAMGKTRAPALNVLSVVERRPELALHLRAEPLSGALSPVDGSALASTCVDIASAFVLSLVVSSSGIVTGAGKQKVTTPILFFNYWLLGLPLGAVFAFHFHEGLLGLWKGMCLAVWLHVLAYVAIAFSGRRLVSFAIDYPAAAAEAAARLEAERPAGANGLSRPRERAALDDKTGLAPSRLAKNSRDADLHSGKGAKQGDVDSKFRGNWNYASRTPTFNAFQFLPTPPPQKLEKPARRGRGEDAVAGLTLAPAVSVEEPVEELAAEPEGDLLRTRRGRTRSARSGIATATTAATSRDGECRNNRDTLLGFINEESGQCGTADEEYLGCISDQSAFNNSDCVIEDAIDEKCGTLDMGTGYIKDFNDRIVAELTHSGVCTGHAGATSASSRAPSTR